MATYWENSCSFGLRFVSWYMYLIVSLVFSHLGFWSGNLFLIAPFPDLCLLVPFSTSSDQSRYILWSCQNVCDALSYLLDNIYIRFGTKVYRQIVGIPMGKNCAPLVADLFLYCYERDFMDSLNHDNQADVIEAFNSTSRYLYDLLNIDRYGQSKLST